MTILPPPDQLLGTGKGKKLPSPDQVFTEQKPEVDLYTQQLTGPDKLTKLNSIVDAIPEIDETKKKIFKDLVLKGTPVPELQSALETLTGKHPHQEGGDKYYYNEKGIPTPLKNDERPPQGFDIANDYHGTQEEANQAGFMNSAGRHLYNGVLKGVLGLENLVNLPYALSEGKDADWYTAAKNRVESSLYKTPEYERENQFFDAKDMKEIGDLLDIKRYKFNANIAQGQVLNGLESITAFLTGTKGLGAAGELAGIGAEASGLIKEGGDIAKFLGGATSGSQKAQAYGSAYAINYPEVLDYAEQSGLQGREKYGVASAITVPIAALEMMFGTEGLFVKNSVAKQAKDNLIKGIVDGIGRDAEGNITKEGLEQAFKATTIEAAKLNKSFAADVVQNIGEEAGTEALQEFTKRGLAKLYDHVSQEDNFKDNPISAEAFGDYFNAALSGAAGAFGPSTAATIQKRKIEVEKKQNNNIFNTVQKGDDAVHALKLNIDKAVKDGEITADQGADAILKVNAYHEYNKQTQGKNLKDEDKRRVFDLTFEKQNLEDQIPTDYEENKLNGIAQAEIETKKKQAKHIQEEIDSIFLKHEVENKTTVKAKKTEEELVKQREKEAEGKKPKEYYSTVDEKGKYKTSEYIKDYISKFKYSDISKEEFNKPKFPTRVKKYLIMEHVNSLPNQTTYGEVKVDNKHKDDNETFNITFEDKKNARFASSQKTDVEKSEEGNITGGHRGNTYQENFDNPENPIGQQLGVTVKTLKDSGRKVGFIWNANKSSPKYGKHIGMIKESLRGNSNYSQSDLDEMADLRMTNMAPESGETITEPTPENPTPNKGINIELGYTPKQPKVVNEVRNREGLRERYIIEQIHKLEKDGDYNPDFQKVYEKSFGEKFDRLNPFLEQKESAVKGTTDEINKVIEVLSKSMPKIKVKYDDTITDKNGKPIAGQAYLDTVFINPKYVGVDTPIHEYGHILIDALGYEDKTIQAAIKQLRGTDLYKETKRYYSELNEQQLDKEVLAEAIGREGAGIFEKESDKSKLLKYLDYIFTKLKQLFGLDKNVAKSLAKQILGGIGTQNVEGKSTEVQAQKVKTPEEIKEMPLADLVSQYWEYVNSGVKGKKFEELKKQLGYKLFQTRKQELLESDSAEKFIEKLANTEDIGKKNILFKTLSHVSENFPELQKFSKEFENANFDMVQESNQLKAEAEKLARAVIEEKNKTLGIKEKAKNLFSSDNAKYFEYLENPEAIEEFDEDTGETTYSSGYWTEEQAKAKGFTPTQIKFLNFMRKLQDLRNEQYMESGNSGEIDGILKVDKGFKEAYKTGDLTEAFSAYLGNTAAIKDTELKFTDPVTGKVGLENYGDIEQKLIAYGKRGVLSKINAMRLMLKYNFQARRRSKEKFGQFSISPNGTLNNKFLKSRDKKRGYSKDFYKAALSFIDDYTHTKHMGKLLPYIDSIEAINHSGYLEHAKKPQTVEYIQKWKDLHLFKNDKQGALGPEVDAALRLLRKVTSLSVMAFNVPAAFWNAGTGIYNNIRAEGGKAQRIGLKRLLQGTDRAKFKAYNKKANDIINKYHVVSSDYDSNPKLFAGKIFDMLANGLNREAEYLIQGSMFLGQLSESDYNNLQYNDKGELEYTGKDKDAFKERVIKYKNRVSDIQGKYAEKDRRNYNLTEFGKSAAQFKNWLPDAIKERFGEQYINADNELKSGTWNSMLGDGFQDLKKQINEKGFGKAIWENKDAMANLKGALTVAVLLSFKLGGDDDKKKRGAVDTLDKALGNVLMIFDPQTLKFTVSNPVASIGTLNRFIDAFEHVIEIDNGIKFDFARAGKDIGKALPYQKVISQTADLLNEE